MEVLHARLVRLQTLENLWRKKIKAERKQYFTQEDIDWANMKAEEWAKHFEMLDRKG